MICYCSLRRTLFKSCSTSQRVSVYIDESILFIYTLSCHDIVSAKMKNEIQRRCSDVFSKDGQNMGSDDKEEEEEEAGNLTHQASSNTNLTPIQRFHTLYSYCYYVIYYIFSVFQTVAVVGYSSSCARNKILHPLGSATSHSDHTHHSSVQLRSWILTVSSQCCIRLRSWNFNSVWFHVPPRLGVSYGYYSFNEDCCQNTHWSAFIYIHTLKPQR